MIWKEEDIQEEITFFALNLHLITKCVFNVC